MIDHKRAIVLVAVVCLLAMPFTALSADGDSDQKVVSKSDTFVLIDVNGTFEDNKEELEVLGVTDPSKWTYNDEYKCNQLELENVNFETTCAYGVIFVATNEHDDFILKITGENSIKSGSTFPSVYPGNEAFALWGWSINLGIIGEGSLRVTCDYNGTGAVGSSAIWVDQGLVIAFGAKVIAETTSFVHECKGELTGNTNIYSYGIYAMKLLVTSNPAGPYTNVTAKSGDIGVKYTGTSKAETEQIKTYGISCPYIMATYSKILAGAGDAGYEVESGATPSKVIMSFSIGINMTEGFTKKFGVESEAIFRFCDVTGLSSDAFGKERGTSKGITMNSNDMIRIIDSTVKTSSGEARAVNPEKSLSTSYGMEFYAVAEVRDSLIISIGGSVVGAINNFSLGLHGKEDMTFIGSIIVAEGDNVGLCTIKKFGVQDFNYLIINDSDILARGGVRAVNGDPEKITFATNWKMFQGLDWNGKVHDLRTADDLISTANEKVRLMFKYDVFISYGNDSISTFERYDENIILVPQFDESLAPEGKVFSKWYFNDKEVYVGQPVKLGAVSFLKAEFKDAPADDNTTITVAVIVVAIIALVLLAMIFVKP